MSSQSETRRVLLTRAQIYDILVWQMGWEPIDVTAFWRLAKPHAVEPER